MVGVIKWLVLVHFTNNQLASLLEFQYQMQERYMKDFYGNKSSDNYIIQSIGADYDNVYGYAQEHHTLELYMRLWKRHNNDVIQKGTPPAIKKIIELSCSMWNK